MIRFSCPTCGFAVQAPVDCTGGTTSCPKCHCPITVPEANGPKGHPGSPTTSSLITPKQSGQTRRGRFLSHVPDQPVISPPPAMAGDDEGKHLAPVYED